MLKKVYTKVFVGLLLATVNFSILSDRATAQQKKVPREPFHIVDASTGKEISEFLIIPRYSTFQGVSTMLGEGPGNGSYRNYLDKPFIYRNGESFNLKLPKSSGFNIGLLFAGKGRSLEGILIIAPKYRPLWFTSLWETRDLWNEKNLRDLKLNPLSDVEWSALLGKELSPLVKNVPSINDNCRFWMLPDKCSLETYYDKKEQELVRSFLQ